MISLPLYKPQKTFQEIDKVTEKILKSKSFNESIETLKLFSLDCEDGGWKISSEKLYKGLSAGEGPYSIFVIKGNMKLPFASFSTLPKFTCPGAGDCLNWCYSFQAWRYPGAWCRQLQNTLLLRYNRDLIKQKFLELKDGLVVRLYVDGDFDSTRTVAFWMRLLRKRPDIKAYGYSKSWDLLYQFHQNDLKGIPENYVCNLSTGGLPQNVSKEKMLKASFVRGEFITVPVKWESESGINIKRLGFKRFNERNYHNAVRQVGLDKGTKFFSCPGLCGNCVQGVHACGSMKFKGIKIAIGEH